MTGYLYHFNIGDDWNMVIADATEKFTAATGNSPTDMYFNLKQYPEVSYQPEKHKVRINIHGVRFILKNNVWVLRESEE